MTSDRETGVRVDGTDEATRPAKNGDDVGATPNPEATPGAEARRDTKGDSTGEASLKKLLASARTVAVVGIKDREQEDAFRIPQYLQRAGYRIVPVNPKLESVLGEPCCATLAQVEGPIDIVNLFRASEHVPAHVDEILAMRPLPKAVWMQLGIHHGPSAQRLRDAGIEVVQDRCMMVDHRRLIGAPAAS